ncbi:hypothetical protein [Paenibacillus hexagrammi]|uniref:Uncharacterized protein n=1 Tax=Paenibacillus hexagrammi TaxID=2908839 RepID=A0ABY3SIV0_9BACL|nr:hypothetical protein [Paenibacillus sp. YPD9-1]UJF33923.1 hypothetical protein L0M14_01310 [Paenibacillus sp. YPD9-1]
MEKLKLQAAARGILDEMDALFEGFFPWLAGQYDPASGGFYYARSSRTISGLMPDIESTAQALNILERCGLLGAMPAEMKKRMVQFFQNKQDPATGYFYDANAHMRDDEVMVARAISYSTGALRKLGSQPLYELPYDAAEAPAYMESPDTYIAWLRSVDLSNSWRGCDRMSTSCVYVRQLTPLERQAAYLEAAFPFFEEIQDKVTGLWGEGSRYERISGTFKLHLFYDQFDVPLPRENNIYASLLECLRSDEAGDMCYIRNPIHLLSYMKLSVPDAELVEILRITCDNMRRLLREDGGFSRELAHSPSAPNVAQVKSGGSYPNMPRPVHIGRGLVEGDMNAGTQAMLIRSVCYRLAGRGEPDWGLSARDFYRDVQERGENERCL